MGRVSAPDDYRAFAAILGADPERIRDEVALLSADLGPVALVSDAIPFTFTDYYEREMGPGLSKIVAVFAPPFPPERLADLKLRTNAREAEDAFPDGRRRINVDPGIVSRAKVVLASTKENSARIYLRDGIYAEVTLAYREGSFRAWPWTYADFGSDTLVEFFNRARELLFARRPPAR